MVWTARVQAPLQFWWGDLDMKSCPDEKSFSCRHMLLYFDSVWTASIPQTLGILQKPEQLDVLLGSRPRVELSSKGLATFVRVSVWGKRLEDNLMNGTSALHVETLKLCSSKQSFSSRNSTAECRRDSLGLPPYQGAIHTAARVWFHPV